LAGYGNRRTTANSVVSLILGNTDVTNILDLPVVTFCLNAESNDLAEFGFFVKANTPFTANQKGAYFRFKNGKVYAVTGDGTNETETEIGNISQYSQYKIEITSTDVRFYTEDLRTLRATHTTNITSNDMTLKISLKNQTANNRILKCEGIALMRQRVK
jgi:sorbitol-specific phosphotransferase system component IIA